MKPRSTIFSIIALWTILSILLGGVTTPIKAAPAVKAFPGAVGYGTDTPGGRGGKVIYVTNLNDSGSGSLRDALTQSGARTVLFKVSGTITLSSDITISQPFLTVAGHSAPGEGVQIRGAQIKISTHDIIIRYLKVRSGDANSSSNPADRDAVAINDHTNAYNIVVDHSTMIWGPDVGGITFLNGSRDSTVSYSIIGEGLYYSAHPEAVASQGGHSLGTNITELNSGNHPTRITMHHNLITTSDDRNPRIIGGESIEIFNNVVYNWGKGASQGNPRSVNLVNNMYIKGPMTKNLNAWTPKAESGSSLRSGSVYESGNVIEGISGMRGGSSSVYASKPFGTGNLGSAEDAKTAYNNVVADAGANRQVASAAGDFQTVRDSVDLRIIKNLVNRSGTFMNGTGNNGGSGYPAVSWPTMANGPACGDQDNDGMPDEWERKYFGNTNRGSSSNSAGDLDGDGYTDLEEFLNSTDPTGGNAPPPQPTSQPTTQPTSQPTANPTVKPTGQPTSEPTVQPTAKPTEQPTAQPTEKPVSGSLTFKPESDATVSQDNAKKNFGGDDTLVVNKDTTKYVFLKFEVSGISGQKVGKVILRLYSVDGSDNGGKLKAADSNEWSESDITWKTKPDVTGDVVASLDRVKPDTWYELDVTSLVKGDGVYAFRLHTPSDNDAKYSSKEGKYAPELVVTLNP